LNNNSKLETKKAALKPMVGELSKINTLNRHPSSPVPKAATVESKTTPKPESGAKRKPGKK